MLDADTRAQLVEHREGILKEVRRERLTSSDLIQTLASAYNCGVGIRATADGGWIEVFGFPHDVARFRKKLRREDLPEMLAKKLLVLMNDYPEIPLDYSDNWKVPEAIKRIDRGEDKSPGASLALYLRRNGLKTRMLGHGRMAVYAPKDRIRASLPAMARSVLTNYAKKTIEAIMALQGEWHAQNAIAAERGGNSERATLEARWAQDYAAKEGPVYVDGGVPYPAGVEVFIFGDN